MGRGRYWIVGVLVVVWIWGVLLGGASGQAGVAGKQAYQKLCQSCHGTDGAGNPQMAKTLKVSIPPVTGAAMAQKDEVEMLRLIAEGKGKMPGYAKQLPAAEQRQVLEYMKTLGRQ